MKLMKKLYAALTIFEETVCSIAFLLLTVGVVCDVVSRKITGNSISWLEESSRMIFMSITMITASVAVTTDEHPRMNAVLVALGTKRGNYLILFTDVLCAAFFLFMLRYAVQSAVNMYTFGTAYTSIPLKVWHTYIFFPLSFAGIAVRYFVKAVMGVRTVRRGEDIERGEES